MAFANTFDSLSNAIVPGNTPPVELSVSNNSITIDPNISSFFYVDDINNNLTINLSNLTDSYGKTIYLRLSFEDDGIVLNWPSKIKWYENVPPMVSKFDDVFISLNTFDGGTTWYSQSIIKVKPLVNLYNYAKKEYPKYGSQGWTFPDEFYEYLSQVRPTSCNHMFSNFYGGNNYDNYITSIDVSNLDTSNVTDMGNMFENCEYVTSLDVTNFDTSNVTTFDDMFAGCNRLTTLDASDWDTSNATSMCYTFSYCSNLTSVDLSNWDTTHVTESEGLFYNCNKLEYIILDSDTVKFTKSNSLRSQCKILVPERYLSFYTSNSAWSSRAAQFEPIENYLISKGNGQILSILTSPAGNMPSVSLYEWAKNTYPNTYQSMTEITPEGETYLNSVKGTTMAKMFANCTNLEEVDMSEWNTGSVSNMSEMFSNCSSIAELDFSNLNTYSVTNTSNMFNGCTSLTDLNLSNVDFSLVSSCDGMFDNCSSLTNIIFDDLKVNNSLIRLLYRDSRFDSILPDLDTSGVTDLDFQYFLSEIRWRSDYYWGGKEFYPTQYLDLTGWDTSHITKMKYLFKSTIGIGALNISTWNTSNVIDMSGMFYFDAPIRFTDDPPPHFTSLDLSNWNTSKVSDMEQMFYQAWDLNILDISNWDTSGIGQTEVYYDEDFGSVYGDMSEMFMRTPLQYLIIGSPTFKFDMKDSNCGSLNGSCKILVPQALLSTYQNATNWSSRASQFDAMENYTIVKSNGTVTVTPNA